MDLIVDNMRNGQPDPVLECCKCSICGLLLDDAQTIEGCGHSFCLSCCLLEFTNPAMPACQECSTKFSPEDVKEMGKTNKPIN